MILLRSILFQIYFALLSVIMCLAWLPALVGPRRWTMWGIEKWGALTLAGLRIICGLRYEVRGAHHLSQTPALYAGKHQAMWDTVVLPVLLKRPSLVLKRQLLRIPFYGWYARRAQMIALDRSGHASALRSLVAQARARIAEGRPVAIFPEGTRKPVGAPPDYKPGIAALYGQLGLPCIPFALNSGAYWTGALRRPGTIVIEFLEPIEPGRRRADFMSELERRIENGTAALLAEARPG